MVSGKGDFLGGALAPGIEISLDALAARAAQLRKVELVEPRSPDRQATPSSRCSRASSTASPARSTAWSAGWPPSSSRPIPRSVAVIATGGLAPLMIAISETLTRHEPDLTLVGLRLIFERNR